MINLKWTIVYFNQMHEMNQASNYLVYNTYQTSDRANYTTTTTGDTMTIRDILNNDTIILDSPK